MRRWALTKYPVSEVRQRIETPLADARGSDRSRDREGAESLEYATVFLKPRTKLRDSAAIRGAGRSPVRWLRIARTARIRAYRRRFGTDPAIHAPRLPNSPQFDSSRRCGSRTKWSGRIE